MMGISAPYVNPLVSSAHKSARIAKILILKLEFRRDHKKKILMSVATMSRLTKRAYLILCPEKRIQTVKG